MGTTYRQLIQALCNARAAPYRTDPERYEAVMEELLFIVQTMLEKLADECEPFAAGQPEQIKR